MALTVKVRERGQITLPRALREQLGAIEGTELLLLPTPHGFIAQVLTPRESLLDLIAELAHDGPVPDLAALDDQIGDELAAPYRDSSAVG